MKLLKGEQIFQSIDGQGDRFFQLDPLFKQWRKHLKKKGGPNISIFLDRGDKNRWPAFFVTVLPSILLSNNGATKHPNMVLVLSSIQIWFWCYQTSKHGWCCQTFGAIKHCVIKYPGGVSPDPDHESY